VLYIIKYDSADSSGILFGVVNDKMFKDQLDDKKFVFTKLTAKGFYGICGLQDNKIDGTTYKEPYKLQ
jgi:hypothetical protein